MAYENMTVEYVYNLLINSFQRMFNNRLRLLPKCFIVVLSKVLAGIFVILYKHAGWNLLQMFPNTASFKTVDVLGHKINPLVQLGIQFGVGEPAKGTSWEGTVRVTAISTGKVLTIGTQLKSELTGLLYNVTANTGIEDATVEVPVYCVKAGLDGNLNMDDVLKFVSPLGFVEQNAVVTGTTNAGTDDETEEHYRNRVKTGYGAQPQGGSLNDYRTWGQEVAGVLQIYPYGDKEHPAGVLLYVAGDSSIYPDRIPDRGLCIAVGEACTYDPDTGIANRKPLTAVLDPDFDESYSNVNPVTVTTFDVYVTGMEGAVFAVFGESLKNELNTYFLNRQPFIRGLDDENLRSDSVVKNAVIAVTNGVALSLQASFDTAKIELDSTEIESYKLGFGELCKLGDLYINGVKYEE